MLLKVLCILSDMKRYSCPSQFSCIFVAWLRLGKMYITGLICFWGFQYSYSNQLKFLVLKVLEFTVKSNVVQQTQEERLNAILFNLYD